MLVGSLLTVPAFADSLNWQKDAGVEWAFGPDQTDSTKHLLHLRCVPGIQYHLETSHDLLEWTTKQSVYGAGQTWIRTLFSVPKPIEEGEVAPPQAETEADQLKEATLVIFARDGEGVWFTWRSLDDGSARARLISGATLSPEWPPVFTGLSGNHQITLMRGGTATSPTGPEVTTALEESDTALWAAIQAGWAGFQTQVAEGNNQVTPGTAQNALGSGFWRIKPIFVDTDHDGLNDDVELGQYHTNPFSVDSDGDSISDGEEILAGTDPNGPANTTDSDGDGIWDDQDADPGDAAVAWFRVPESSYGLIELGAPENIVFGDEWGFHLGESGHVLISRNREEEWPEFSKGVNAGGFPGAEYFQTFVWQPTTGAWSSLSQPANLRGIGTAIDAEGNVYGKGVGALGPNQTWPGIKNVPLRWKKQPAGWSAASLEDPGDQEVASSFSNQPGTCSSKGDTVVGPVLFGSSGRIVSHSTGYLQNSVVRREIHRIGAGDLEPLVTLHAEDLSASPAITTSNQLLGVAGEPGGWHSLSWSEEQINPDTYETSPPVKHIKLCHLKPAVSNAQGEILATAALTEAEPPAGDERWDLQTLASINLNRLPSNVSAAVVWRSTNNLHVGTRMIGSSNMNWLASTRANTEQRISGKINARGEAILANRVWRNGRWVELSSLLPNGSAWSELIALDINSSGTILIHGKLNGERKIALLAPL